MVGGVNEPLVAGAVRGERIRPHWLLGLVEELDRAPVHLLNGSILAVPNGCVVEASLSAEVEFDVLDCVAGGSGSVADVIRSPCPYVLVSADANASAGIELTRIHRRCGRECDVLLVVVECDFGHLHIGNIAVPNAGVADPTSNLPFRGIDVEVVGVGLIGVPAVVEAVGGIQRACNSCEAGLNVSSIHCDRVDFFLLANIDFDDVVPSYAVSSPLAP